MIAEFALTPAIFDQTAHPDVADWRLWLNTLGHRMFPQPNLCPVMVTDLSGLWPDQARQAVDRITDHRVRTLAQQLLTRMGSRLVPRPLSAGAADPLDEGWWAKSSCASCVVEAIERVIASAACRAKHRESHPIIRELGDVERDEFWENVSVEWSPAATVSAQVATLRKLCVHGEFVWIAAPYAAGMVDDETPFACEVIRNTFRRPHSFPNPLEVELHTQLPRNVPVANHLNSVRHSVLAALRPGQTVRQVVWEKFEDRIVLAGVLRRTTEGRQHAPRWGVHMGHIARRTDVGRGVSHEWKQLNDDRVGHWFRFFDARTPPRFITTVDITR